MYRDLINDILNQRQHKKYLPIVLWCPLLELTEKN